MFASRPVQIVTNPGIGLKASVQDIDSVVPQPTAAYDATLARLYAENEALKEKVSFLLDAMYDSLNITDYVGSENEMIMTIDELIEKSDSADSRPSPD